MLQEIFWPFFYKFFTQTVSNFMKAHFLTP